jgi:hypothetical protein
VPAGIEKMMLKASRRELVSSMYAPARRHSSVSCASAALDLLAALVFDLQRLAPAADLVLAQPADVPEVRSDRFHAPTATGDLHHHLCSAWRHRAANSAADFHRCHGCSDGHKRQLAAP